MYGFTVYVTAQVLARGRVFFCNPIGVINFRIQIQNEMRNPLAVLCKPRIFHDQMMIHYGLNDWQAEQFARLYKWIQQKL